MNAVVNPLLWPVFEQLNRMFPEPTPLTDEERRADLEAEERDQQRAEFVAKRTPELVRQYRQDDERIDAALKRAARQPSKGMRLAYRNEDTAELGRLLYARMCVFMHDKAKIAAEDEGYRFFPEVTP